jgi:hypothetical protein
MPAPAAITGAFFSTNLIEALPIDLRVETFNLNPITNTSCVFGFEKNIKRRRNCS